MPRRLSGLQNRGTEADAVLVQQPVQPQDVILLHSVVVPECFGSQRALVEIGLAREGAFPTALIKG